MYDITLVGKARGHLQLIKKETHRSRKSGLDKLSVTVRNSSSHLHSLWLSILFFKKKQQQTDMAFSLKAIGIITNISFCTKKENLKKKILFNLLYIALFMKRNLVSFLDLVTSRLALYAVIPNGSLTR